MKTASGFPREYRFPVSQDHLRTIKDPHLEDVTITHAFVKVRDLPTGDIPDRINPRSHDANLTGKVPQAIEGTIEEFPERFHLLNRGCLVLAKKSWYDSQSRILHVVIETDEEHGMVDGATTDRVLAELKNRISNTAFEMLTEEEIPERFKKAYIHLEIIAGADNHDALRLQLAEARNTSVQVKEFSLQDLGKHFDWLKDILENSEFRGKIRYRENEPRRVDIRMVLALLTLFHPKWFEEKKDPIVAYSGKGAVLDYYKDPDWKDGYRALEPVVLDILRLYDHIHVEFPKVYQKAYGTDGRGARLGLRKEVHYIQERKKAKVLDLTGKTTQHVLPDGWLYPLLGSFRVLLHWPKNGKGQVKWAIKPFDFFLEKGDELAEVLVEGSKELGQNPNATGKSKPVWVNLRDKVENSMLKERILQLENE